MSLAMIALYTVLDIVFINRVKSSFGILQMNILVAMLCIGCAMWYEQTRSTVYPMHELS